MKYISQQIDKYRVNMQRAKTKKAISRNYNKAIHLTMFKKLSGEIYLK